MCRVRYVSMIAVLAVALAPAAVAGADVNQPPGGGTIEITPTTGVALETMFQLSAEGWVDPEGHGIIYQAKYRHVGQQTTYTLTGFSYSPSFNLILPPGELEVIMVISDLYGANTSASVFVTVVPGLLDALVGVESGDCLWDGDRSRTGVTVAISPESGAVVTVSGAGGPYEFTGTGGSVAVGPGIYSWAAVAADGYELVGEATGAFATEDCSPRALITDLVGAVAVLNLDNGISNALDAKLDNAVRALEDVNDNNDGAAVNKLQAFINEAEAQAGSKIDRADADALIAAAQLIIGSLTG